MGINKISNIVTGYVNIRVEGFYIERFINICISKKILLHDIAREKSTILHAKVGINDYKRLREIAKKTKSKIKIEGKVGLPFVMHRYRKRKIFAISFIIIIVTIISLSNYVWNIEIEGTTNISKEELLKTLEESGLYIGISKEKLDTKSVIDKIRLERDDIAWIGISVKGTNAMIKVKESKKAPEVINKDEYCNIISDKTGVITKINVQNGTAAVSPGDIVKSGDILVEGYVEGTYTGKRYVHSIADIEAKTWYTKKTKEPLNTQIPVQTGKEENKYSVNIKNFRINFYKTLSKFQKYDKIDTTKKFELFSNFYLPIEIIKTTNKEYVMQDITYTPEELTEIAAEKLKKELETEIGDDSQIINSQVNTYSYEGYIEVEVIYEVLEKIGTKDKIIF